MSQRVLLGGKGSSHQGKPIGFENLDDKGEVVSVVITEPGCSEAEEQRELHAKIAAGEPKKDKPADE